MELKPVNKINSDANTIRVSDGNSPIRLIFKDVKGEVINLYDKIDYFYLTKDDEKFYSVTDISYQGDEVIIRLPKLRKGKYKAEIRDKDGSIYPANEDLYILLRRSFEDDKDIYYFGHREDILNSVEPIIIQHIDKNPNKFKGERGPQGFPGRDGLRGRDGIDGINGKDGIDGEKGEKGDPGLPGKDGLPGEDGKDGKDGELSKENLDDEVIKIKDLISSYGLNVKDFGALGDGVTDDTLSIQNAIDKANETGIKKVFIPSGHYKTSKSIILNGCSIEGVKANVYGGVNNGVVIEAITNDFSIIEQGSVLAKNIEFSVNNITVKNGLCGFEITYVINSQFNNLHALDCDIGYILGKPSSVGSMFCIFNNLYSQRCRIGVDIDSKEYFNNNIFNNGYIQGNEYALKLKVTGGYGAVNNSFNNVELRSPLGRGIFLSRCRETEFNKCYFETGGSGIVTDTSQIHSYNINNCVFGLFKKDNTFKDNCLILNDDLGGRVLISGGTIFTNSEFNNCFLYSGGDINPYQTPFEISKPNRTGAVTNFNMYSGLVNNTFE